MNKIGPAQIIAIVVGVIGFIFLVVSALYVIELVAAPPGVERGLLGQCQYDREERRKALAGYSGPQPPDYNECEPVESTLAAAALGLIASLIMLGGIVLALIIPDMLIWCGSQALAWLFVFVAFVLTAYIGKLAGRGSFRGFIYIPPLGADRIHVHNSFFTFAVIIMIALPPALVAVFLKFRGAPQSDQMAEFQDQPPYDPEMQSQVDPNAPRPPTAPAPA